MKYTEKKISERWIHSNKQTWNENTLKKKKNTQWNTMQKKQKCAMLIHSNKKTTNENTFIPKNTRNEIHSNKKTSSENTFI